MPGLVLIRGGGDLASGVTMRLHRAGLNVAVTELAQPLAVRRAVSFADAIYEKEVTVEDVPAHLVVDPADTLKTLNILSRRKVAVLVDPDCESVKTLHPIAIVDGRMTKHAPEPLRHDALLYLGLGPGFSAPENCQAVIETQRGHTLGRVIWSGKTLSDTAQPEGDPRRVLRAPVDGILKSSAKIGDHFEPGESIAEVEGQAIKAPFTGVLRGLIHPELFVTQGLKIGDLDPRDKSDYCFMVSDKALAVGGGVLEALLSHPEVRKKLWA